MADTVTASGLIAEKWSAKFFKYGLQNMFFGKFIGRSMTLNSVPKNHRPDLISTDPNAMIQVVMDLTKSNGDGITFPLLAPLSNNGQVNGTLEGNEEGISNYEFKQSVVDWGHATRDAGQLIRQRAAFEWDPAARETLAMWYARALDEATYCALAGLAFTGDNSTDLVAASAPSRKIVCGAPSGTFEVNTNDSDMAATDYFSLDAVGYARRIAVATEPTIRPWRIGGEDMYLMFIHPLQAKALKATSAWITLQQTSNRYLKSKSPIFNGMLGVYDGVILYEYQRTKTRLGAGGSTAAEYFDSGDDFASGVYAARAIFAGAQAVVHAYAKKPTFTRKDFDYGNKHGYAVRMLAGVGRPEFNSVDFGSMVVDTAILAD
ncbi:MAG: N4-gp56 family major capsid protein [Planctomycetes bacterium]|nr:N4-gp56 family major capsid protein [Planctomycetota bacterium]